MTTRPVLTAAFAAVVVGLVGLVVVTAARPAAAPPPLLLVATPRAARPTAVSHRSLKVYVAGAVANPGVYTLRLGDRVDDAVRAAGGMTASADPTRVNLAALLSDGQEILVPVRGQPVQTTRVSTRSMRRAANTAGASAVVNINTANEAQLRTLRGIGKVTAQKILAYRQTHGPFTGPSDLLKAGVHQAELQKIENRLAW